jgi:MFS transporter, PPP family, 3-phenylpropionic acid transporter
MDTVFQTPWKKRVHPNLRGTIVFLVTFFAVGAFMPFVNLAFDQRGLSESQIGLYNALPGAITIISGPILCRLADKKRARVMFSTIGFLMLAVFTALMTIPWGFLWLLSLQIIYSAFSPPITPIRDGLAARMANKYGLDFGNWRLWGSLGFAVASLVMGMVWQRIGIEWLFLGAAALFLFSGVVVNLLEEPEEDKIIQQTELWHQWIPRESVVWLFLSAVFLSNLAQQAFYQFSAIHMIRLGGSETMAGMMRSASAVVEIPTMYLVSKLIRKIGPMWSFLIGASIFALSWLGFSLATAGWMLIAITAFRGNRFRVHGGQRGGVYRFEGARQRGSLVSRVDEHFGIRPGAIDCRACVWFTGAAVGPAGHVRGGFGCRLECCGRLYCDPAAATTAAPEW